VTTTSSALRDAAVLGGVSGMRTFTGLGVLALRKRIQRQPTRYLLMAGAVGELVGDKSPMASARTSPPAYAGRIAAGAIAGRLVAGATGAAVGAGTAAASTAATYKLRKDLGATLPDPALGAIEDALALGLAAAATRTEHVEPTEAPALSPAGSIARGVTAGAVGTTVMTFAQGLLDGPTSHTPEKVGRTFIKRLTGKRVPRKHRDALNQGMHWAYGTSWGGAYGLIAGRLPHAPNPLAGGVVLGLGAWVTSLIELPALGVAKLPWEQSASSLAKDAGLHLVYGLATATVLRAES
jgi:hypothetical protein